MDIPKCLYCRYQTVQFKDDYAGGRVTNKALQRPFTLLLSFHPSTSLHSFSNTIIFYHTIQPSPLIGRNTVGSYGLSRSNLFVSEDRQRWKDAITSNQRIKRNFEERVSIIPPGWERGVHVLFFLLKKQQFFLTLGSEIRNKNMYMYYICSKSKFCTASLRVMVNKNPSIISQKPVCSFNDNDIRNSINNVLSTRCKEFYGNQALYYATFVGGGYNRILLAFSSLLCGQIHLNVSTVSCLFRNRLEIGNTNASPASITVPAALFCICGSLFTPDFYGSHSNNAGDSGLIYSNRCYNCALMAPN